MNELDVIQMHLDYIKQEAALLKQKPFFSFLDMFLTARSVVIDNSCNGIQNALNELRKKNENNLS